MPRSEKRQWQVSGEIRLTVQADTPEQAQELAKRRERSLSTYRGCEVYLAPESVTELEEGE